MPQTIGNFFVSKKRIKIHFGDFELNLVNI